MTSNIVIRDSVFSDINALVKTLREKDVQECLKLGITPKRGLIYGYKNAFYKKTALVDGQIAAMWGVAGQTLSDVGYPYLMTGEASETISPLRFVRIYQNEVKNMLSYFNTLINLVDEDYKESMRLLELSGFSLEEGPQGFKRFIMRNK